MSTKGNEPERPAVMVEAIALEEDSDGFGAASQSALLDRLRPRHREEVTEESGFVRASLSPIEGDDGRLILAKRDELTVRRSDITNDDEERALREALLSANYHEDGDASSANVVRFRFMGAAEEPEVRERNFLDEVKSLRVTSTKIWPNLLCAASAPPTMKGGAGPHPAPRGLPPRADRRVGAGVRVAVIDTGIWGDAEHRSDGWLDGIPEDPSRMNIDPLDVIGNDKLLDLGAGHGTFVAGLIRQVAPGAKVTVIRALDSDGCGTDQSVAQAIRDAVQGPNAAEIIHLSLGGPGLGGEPPPEIAAAVVSLDPEVLVVAAAGNEGTSTEIYPAALPRVVAVGALQRDLQPASWSSRGAWVDVWTVGHGAISTFVIGDTDPVHGTPSHWSGPNPVAMWSGTSYAAPQVTGIIAAAMTERRGCLGLFRRRRRTANEAYAGVLKRAKVLPGGQKYVAALDFTIPHPTSTGTDLGRPR